MTGRFIIYGLVDPRDGQLRYVGQTSQVLGKRVVQHVRRSSWGPHHRDRWLRELGRCPDAFELESCATRAEADEAERFFIAYFRGLGCRLTNLTDGGGAWSPSEEQRRRMSMTRQGRRRSEYARAAIAAGVRSRFRDSQERARMSAARGGRSFVDENGTMYVSLGDAAARLGVNPGDVSRALRHGWSVKGHRFGYLEAA